MSVLVSILPASLRPYAKAVVAVLGAVLVIVPQLLPLLPDAWQAGVTSVVSVLAALGVYATPNTNPDSDA